MIEANLGEIVFVNVTATDNNSFTFDVLNEPQGASFSTVGIRLDFTWNVTSADKVNIHTVSIFPNCTSFWIVTTACVFLTTLRNENYNYEL